MMYARLKMLHEGTALVQHFKPRVILFQCFVMWPATSLKLYIIFWDGGETQVSIVCLLKIHTDLMTIRG